jgi:UDP-N-acetylmuramate--alanine ligase
LELSPEDRVLWPPIPGITLDVLEAQVREHVKTLVVVPDVSDVPGHVAMLAQDGDLIVTLGAGSIGMVADRVLAALRQMAGLDGREVPR